MSIYVFDAHKIPLGMENLAPRSVGTAEVRVGRVIPVEYYAAVAEVLAFVYRLKNRGRRA